VDDNSAVRSLVLFELEPDFEISGEAENGRDAVDSNSALLGLVLCHQSAVTMRSFTEHASAQLAAYSGRSATGRTTNGKRIS